MKKIYLLLVIVFISFAGCKTSKQLAKSSTDATSSATTAPVNFSEQTTWILGYFNPRQLAVAPYSTWYLKGYDEYMPKTDAINKLLDINKDDISIKVVMGTWCPDSRREVPRFMKVLDFWSFPVEKVTFIGVDDAKQSPVGEFIHLDIHRVPTIIVYKNNIEAGRIIENPATSLEQDMVNILTGMNTNK